MRLISLLAAMFIGAFGVPLAALAQGAPQLLRQHAEAGTLAEGEGALHRLATASPQDAEARMALGFLQVARAVERLGQDLHRYGLQAPRQRFVPILRMPVPPNPSPEKLDYAKLRAVYAEFLAGLSAAERTLAAIPAGGDPKLVLNLSKVRLDLDRNGRADEGETLGRVIAGVMNQRGEPVSFEVAFDRADATWLRGYTHLLSSFLEFVLAYDWSETYAAAGHHYFAGAREPGSPLHGDAAPNLLLGTEGATIADTIAMIHLIRWPLAEPERMKRALAHLKRVPDLSRQNWREILAENDDDREWLPSPKQRSGGLGGLSVTQERVDGWMKVMDEFDAVLDGRKLVAHWRFQKGFDLRAFFENPRPFDLVLWITGHGAAPYMKDGPLVSSETTRQWQMMFSGNFLAYAFWFN
jgi:hypothetical protein